MVSCFLWLDLVLLICTLTSQELISCAWPCLGRCNLALSGLCTVWATDLGFVAPTGAHGPGPHVLLSIVVVGPNNHKREHLLGHVDTGFKSLLVFSLLLH